MAQASYVTSSYLEDYLSNAGFVSSSELSESLGPYLSESDVTAYLSEGLAGLSSFMTEDDLATAGYVSSSSFASALEQYLSDYGGETIYNAISQYINPQAE